LDGGEGKAIDIKQAPQGLNPQTFGLPDAGERSHKSMVADYPLAEGAALLSELKRIAEGFSLSGSECRHHGS
jgi:hypothetical protein